VPEYTTMITEWVKEVARTPVIVKLTPNVSDITKIALAAEQGGADGISLINTINSLMGVDLDSFAPRPSVRGKSSHGGFCGPAVKPIALHMVSACAKRVKIPISGIGGIATWSDAAEFVALGATSLQVCTAVMHYGYRIIEDLCDGLSNWMDGKGFATIPEVVGRSLSHISDFKNFDLSFRAIARIDQGKCIRCNLCYVACNDTAHQCIDLIAKDGSVVRPHSYDIRSNGREEAVETRPHVHIRENDCVGCRLCFNVCPVEDCIQMIEEPSGREHLTWERLTREQPEVAEDWDEMQKYRAKMGIEIH